jgi:hypothetical protein
MLEIVRKAVKIEDKYWSVYNNTRHEEGDFKAQFHCAICDPEGKKFYPKLIKVDSFLVCGHCVMNMTKALNKATISDCKKGERH